MISEIKRTYDPGAIYLVNEDITRCHISDNPTNGKMLYIGTPVVYIQTIQQTDCIVRDYTGQLWRLSRDDLDPEPVSKMHIKSKMFLYKLPFFLIPLGILGAVVLSLLGLSFFYSNPDFTVYMWYAALICFATAGISFLILVNPAETARYYLYTNPENLQELEVLLEAQKADVGKEQKT